MSNFYGAESSERAKEVYDGIEIEPPISNFVLGPYNSHSLLTDPKHLGFSLARYKFVAKMLHGYDRVFEIGCQEGLGTMVVAQVVGEVTATDFYKPHIESCLARLSGVMRNVEFRGHDIIDGPVGANFDGGFALDVFEHIDPAQEAQFLAHVAASLTPHGAFLLGTPSLESQAYASPQSRAGHINCKSGEELRSLCQRFFHSVFMFGMNDEVLHTGYLPMAHYLIALCVDPKSQAS